MTELEMDAMRYAEWYRERIQKPFKALRAELFGWDAGEMPVWKVLGEIPKTDPEVSDGSLFADLFAKATPLHPVEDYVYVWGHQLGLEPRRMVA